VSNSKYVAKSHQFKDIGIEILKIEGGGGFFGKNVHNEKNDKFLHMTRTSLLWQFFRQNVMFA